MSARKYLVVSREKNKRGCYDVYGWTHKKIRGDFFLEGNPIRVITDDIYLNDFGEWDIPISKEHIGNIKKDKNYKVEIL